MLATLVLNKLVAIVGGPSAYVVLGQVQNIYQIISSAIFGSGNIAITKHLSDTELSRDKKSKVVDMSYRINLSLASLISIVFMVMYFLSPDGFVFNKNNRILYLVLAITCIPLSISTMYLAVFNGIRDIKAFVKSNIVQSAIVIAGALAVYKTFGIVGMLAIFLVAQPLSLAYMHGRLPIEYRVRLRHISRSNKLNWELFRERFGPYAFVSVVGVALVPITLIAVRHILVDNYSPNTVGLWEAAHRTSQLFMIPLSSILSLYFLPKFSSNKSLSLVRGLIDNSQFLIAYLFIGVFVIFFFDNVILEILYSSEFLAASALLKIYIMGSVVYFLTMVIQYYYLAHSSYLKYVVFEVIRSLGYIFGVLLSTNLDSKIVGVAYAYVIANSLVLALSVLLLRKTRVFER